jgi:hypothetical protein
MKFTFKGNHSKTFMSSNLNKMSIKDYFKYLYDEIMKKRKYDSSSTILSRMPSLIMNNNKSIGAYEGQNYDLEKINGKFLYFLVLTIINFCVIF